MSGAQEMICATSLRSASIRSSQAGLLTALKSCRAYAAIAVGLAIVFLILRLFPVVMVGDGSEYYAIYIAFKKSLRPWMTDLSFLEYGKLVASGEVSNLFPPEMLSELFSALRLGATSDFNHFWIYSLLAFIVESAARVFGVALGPHSAFMATHWVLLCLPVFLAYRYYGWGGVVAVVGITLGSPLLWFMNKVHTEFFTYCLGLAAVICVMRGRFVGAALVLALASTQNPSFAIVVAFLLCVRVFTVKGGEYSTFEVIAIALAVILVMLHPAYYFFRFGVPTPQLLAGGAAIGGNLGNAYVWIFDPDLGLLPNWPLGLSMLAVWMIAAGKVHRVTMLEVSSRSVTVLFAIFYLVVSLYAQSSTQNLNSGGTLGVSRYALWYVPLAFPIAVSLVEWVRQNRIAAAVGALGFFVLLVSSVVGNSPRKSESNGAPSFVSYFVQSRLPWIYNPPAEVFLERYSGVGEMGAFRAAFMAVVGPDCRKTLLLPGAERMRVAVPPGCWLDAEVLSAVLKQRQTSIMKEEYFTLREADVEAAAFAPKLDEPYALNDGGNGGVVLGRGWSGRESWGVWSDGARAELLFPCAVAASLQPLTEVRLTLTGFTHPKRSGTAVRIVSGGQELWGGMLNSDPKDVGISVSGAHCKDGRISVDLLISNPESPLNAGISSDARQIGVGLLAFKYVNEP